MFKLPAAEFCFPEKCFSATEGSSSAKTEAARNAPSAVTVASSRPAPSVIAAGRNSGCKVEINLVSITD